MDQETKYIIDTFSISMTIATIASWLPPIAAIISIIWTTLRIWEMITGKRISDRRKKKRE